MVVFSSLRSPGGGGVRLDGEKVPSVAKVVVGFIDKLADLHALPDPGGAAISSLYGVLMQLLATFTRAYCCKLYADQVMSTE